MTTVLSDKGQISLPVPVREQLHLVAGEDFEIFVEDEDTITLRRVSQPDRKSTRLNSSHTVISTLSLHDALPILADRRVASKSLPLRIRSVIYFSNDNCTLRQRPNQPAGAGA